MLKPVIAFARARGLDATRLLQSIGVASELLDQLDARIAEPVRQRLWTAVAEAVNEPYLGLRFAEGVPLGTYDALDYAMSFSATFGDSVDRILRFHRILCDAWAMTRHSARRRVHLRRVHITTPADTEAFAAVLVLRGRAAIGDDLCPVEVRFAHRRSASVKGYREFFHCPVHHSCRTTELVFRQSDLERPARAPNPGLNRVLDRYMTELAGRFPALERLVDRTRAAIVHLLGRGARPTLAKVGAEVAASSRTIQRHLEADGLTYFALVSTVRRQLAERLVTDRQLSLTEIAYLLGFADLSGFRRAYRGWTGEAPATARSRAHAPHRRTQRPG